MRYQAIPPTILSFALAGNATAANESWDFAVTELDRVELILDAADLTISGGSRVAIVLKTDGDECDIDVERDGRTFRLELERERLADCDDVELEVTLPASVAGRIKTGAGDIRLRKVAARLEIKTGAGNIEGTTTAVLKAKSGAGNIDLEGLVEPVDVKTGAGNIELALAKVVDGEIRAKTGVGNVAIDLASDAPVDAHVSSGMGHARVGVNKVAGSPTVIRASSGVGNVTVDD